MLIDDELRELAALLAGHLPSDIVSELLGYVDAGEAKVGLEQLCDILYDKEESLTPIEAALIHRIGTALEVTRSSFLYIDELVADE
jgi:hypothetical protein